MRQRFNPEPDFPITPIEKILLPLQSRDELPPILALACSGSGCIPP
jgi:hypothetical protein